MARRTWSKIVGGYERPFPRLPPLLCLEQRSFPLFAGVVLSALLRKDGIGNSEGAMRRAIVAGCIAGTVKLLRSGFADWANEGHRGYALSGDAGPFHRQRQIVLRH